MNTFLSGHYNVPNNSKVSGGVNMWPLIGGI